MKENRWIFLCICVIIVMLCGCSAVPVSGKAGTPAAFAAAEEKVLTIDERSVTGAEASVYLYLMQKPYEAYFGSDLWQLQREDGRTWEKWLLEEVQLQIVEMEILSRRAEKEGMALSDEEKQSADAAADAALEVMGDAAERYGITVSCIRNIYEKSKLAGLYYQTVTDGYDMVLSEEESAGCRGMTVQQIFIAEDDTEHLENGQTQKQLAEELSKRAAEGEDFETLAKAYSSENAQWTLSFDGDGYVFDTDGWLEEDFTSAAWVLQENEISPVIHTSYGYHVLKCTAVDSENLKEQAAEKRLNDKKKEAFSADYEKWRQEIVMTEETAWQEMHALEGI